MSIAAACFALVLPSPPDAPAADGTTTNATLVATVAGARTLDAVPDPAGRTIFLILGANPSAGGLHRTLSSRVMAWADVQRPGRVYRVDP